MNREERNNSESLMKDTTKAKDQLMHEITESHQVLEQTEQYKHLATQIIELINKKNSSNDFVRDVLFLIKIVTGFEAVGIRIKEGAVFPYYETIGFSEDFINAKKHLCARDRAGASIRDSEGNLSLECMCGKVICGRTNPSLSFFTEGGSFWTNSTSALLASAAEKGRHSRTRNRCNSSGYESVALVPLRCENRIIGLLQINDRRKNIFSSRLIRLLERVGLAIGAAFKLKQAEDIFPQSEQSVAAIDDTIITFHDENFNIICANKTAKKILGLPPLDGDEVKCYRYYHGKNYPPPECPSVKSLLSREPIIFEMYEPHLRRCIKISTFPQFDRNDKFTGMIHFVRDITREHIVSDQCENNYDLR